MHPFLVEGALVGLCGCDVVDTDRQDLGDGTNGLYPSGVGGWGGFLPFPCGVGVGGVWAGEGGLRVSALE